MRHTGIIDQQQRLALYRLVLIAEQCIGRRGTNTKQQQIAEIRRYNALRCESVSVCLPAHQALFASTASTYLELASWVATP
jgi:hypothetical protein